VRILRASSAESERLSKVISAAQIGSWATFKSLSDQPFLNEEAMIEQFEASSRRLQSMNYQWNLDVTVTRDKGGSRALFARLEHGQTSLQPLILILHSTSEEASSQIGIWAFYENIDFS
jgi:hypothetical protein